MAGKNLEIVTDILHFGGKTSERCSRCLGFCRENFMTFNICNGAEHTTVL